MTKHEGYRDQLNRARRFLDRVFQASDADWADANENEFRDLMWAFFQNCWHVKDWIQSDTTIPVATKDEVYRLAHQSAILAICQQLCNGTKHLGPRPGASHDHVATTIAPGWGISDMDCMINDGHGNIISGKELARDCIAEWECILRSQGLAVQGA